MSTTSSAAARRDAGQGERLLRGWRTWSRRPGGRWLFSLLVGRTARYTGSIGARIDELEPGRAVVRLRDRPAVRNHLRSVHAIALANLGELASGLAAVTALPPGVRGIPVAIHVEYVKKARGMLTATGSVALPHSLQASREQRVDATRDLEDDAPGELRADAFADIRDGAGDTVARVRVEWKLERV